MRISDGSSDVCSSDLAQSPRSGWFWGQLELPIRAVQDRYRQGSAKRTWRRHEIVHIQRRDTILMKMIMKAVALATAPVAAVAVMAAPAAAQSKSGIGVVDVEQGIGRAACGERVCRYVEIM